MARISSRLATFAHAISRTTMTPACKDVEGRPHIAHQLLAQRDGVAAESAGDRKRAPRRASARGCAPRSSSSARRVDRWSPGRSRRDHRTELVAARRCRPSGPGVNANGTSRATSPGAARDRRKYAGHAIRFAVQPDVAVDDSSGRRRNAMSRYAYVRIANLSAPGLASSS